MAKTTKCSDCGGMVSKNAKTCPHCGAKVRKPVGKLGLAIAFTFLALLIYGMAKDESPPTGPIDPKSTASTSGWTACREEVRARLKSPSTADFPWRPDKVVDIGGGSFMVIGHVDAQNSFGAMLRTNFSCKVRVDTAARTYSIDEVNMN